MAFVIPVLVPAQKGKDESGQSRPQGLGKALAPVSRKTRKLFGPKRNFEIKTCYIAAQFLAHKPVNFASFTNSFIVLHILKITETLILNANTKQLSGPEKLRRLSGNRPLGTRLEYRSMAHGQRMVYQAQYYLKYS